MTTRQAQAILDAMSNQSYLAKFGINGWALGGHRFDPCPISGRCGVCGLRPEVHPVGRSK